MLFVNISRDCATNGRFSGNNREVDASAPRVAEVSVGRGGGSLQSVSWELDSVSMQGLL